jgi:hypothetical protein
MSSKDTLKEELMAKNSFHVILNPHGGWVVKKGEASRASRNFDTQEDAIAWGKRVSRNEAAEIVIHRPDGTIRSRDTYGSDPLPPRDSASSK